MAADAFLPARHREMLRALAAVQVFAAAYGIALVVMALWRQPVLGASSAGFFLVTAYLGLAVFAGVELWRMRRRGGTLSVVVQALQVPLFILPAMSWEVYLGAKVAVGLKVGCSTMPFGLHASLDVDTVVALHLWPDTSCVYVACNLPALAALWVLHRALEGPDSVGAAGGSGRVS